MVDLLPPPTVIIDGILLKASGLSRPALVTGDIQRITRKRGLRIATFKLQFAVAMLYELDYLYPQLVIDDFAHQHHGEEGILFMFDRGDAFPRADVMGIRKSNGSPEQLFMKQVDLARKIHCFAQHNGVLELKLDMLLWLDTNAGIWQRVSESDTRVNPLLRYALRCYQTNLTDLDKIVEMVPALP